MKVRPHTVKSSGTWLGPLTGKNRLQSLDQCRETDRRDCRCTGEKCGHVTRNESDLPASFAWSPDSRQILYVKRTQDAPLYRIFLADPDSTVVAPKPLSALDIQRNYSDFAFPPTANRFCSIVVKEPLLLPANNWLGPDVAMSVSACITQVSRISIDSRRTLLFGSSVHPSPFGSRQTSKSGLPEMD